MTDGNPTALEAMHTVDLMALRDFAREKSNRFALEDDYWYGVWKRLDDEMVRRVSVFMNE